MHMPAPNLLLSSASGQAPPKGQTLHPTALLDPISHAAAAATAARKAAPAAQRRQPGPGGMGCLAGCSFCGRSSTRVRLAEHAGEDMHPVCTCVCVCVYAVYSVRVHVCLCVCECASARMRACACTRVCACAWVCWVWVAACSAWPRQCIAATRVHLPPYLVCLPSATIAILASVLKCRVTRVCCTLSACKRNPFAASIWCCCCCLEHASKRWTR